jgi:hypothetical protein
MLVYGFAKQRLGNRYLCQLYQHFKVWRHYLPLTLWASLTEFEACIIM